MPHTAEQKIKLLVLYDLLCKLTDENHALNTDEIISLLAEKGIAVSRRILLQDIALLNEYGYEVLSYKKKFYYFYVVNRHFDAAEIAFLVDAVQASKLSAKQKQTFTDKLMATMGDFQATELIAAAQIGTMPKRNNRYIIYTIDTLKQAIVNNKKVSFRYYSLDYKKNKVYRKDGERYVVNPLVRKEDDGLYLRVPEDFVAHLKGGDEKKDLTAQEFIAAIEGKTDEDYESVYRAPSEEAIKRFEKVEGQLRKNVPAEMLNKPNWVVVRTRENAETGRLDKFLINPHTGEFAESDNLETWSDFDTACKYAKENGGVCLAYALDGKDGIACIDLDGCMQENGDFSEIAEKAFNAGDGSYAEKSVSGKGLHIFGKTKGADLRSFSKDKTMEYYQGGHFIAMTGDNYGSSELKSFDTPEMQSVLESKLEKRTEWKHTGEGVEGLSAMDNREMLEKAFKAKNGDTVKRLYNGEDLRNNHSNSDMSLMNYLAFWSNHDIDQMLRVFATSGLYRADKPQSYYEHTAIKAVKGTPVYNPPKASNNKPSGNGNGSGKDGK